MRKARRRMKMSYREKLRREVARLPKHEQWLFTDGVPNSEVGWTVLIEYRQRWKSRQDGAK